MLCQLAELATTLLPMGWAQRKLSAVAMALETQVALLPAQPVLSLAAINCAARAYVMSLLVDFCMIAMACALV